jgi:hypothetical protein
MAPRSVVVTASATHKTAVPNARKDRCPTLPLQTHYGRTHYPARTKFRWKRYSHGGDSCHRSEAHHVQPKLASVHAAQTNEKRKFQILLSDVCAGLSEPERVGRMGRPTIPVRDAIFSAIYKIYSTVSGRRFISDLTAAHEKGYIGKLPCYNSVFNILDSEDTTVIPLVLVAAIQSCSSSRTTRAPSEKQVRDL